MIDIDSITQSKIDRMAEDMRAAQSAAFRKGMILVKISTRRYVVSTVYCNQIGESSYLSGHVEFGPDTESKCLDWFKAEVKRNESKGT